MGWLYLFLARSATGERWRKATPAEKRYFAGFFFFIPLVFTLVLILQRSDSRVLRFMDTAGVLTLWLAFTMGVSAGFIGCYAWGKHVSAKISIVLAIVAWSVLLFMLFGLGFWDFGKPATGVGTAPQIPSKFAKTRDNTTLTLEQAGLLAQQLANERAQTLYNCQPFYKAQRARFADGHWSWHQLQAQAKGDMEANVEFKEDGSEPNVSVMRLESLPNLHLVR